MLPFVRFRDSISAQLIGWTVLTLGVVALWFGSNLIDSQRQMLLEELDRDGRLLSRTAAASCLEPLLVQGDGPVLETFITELVEGSPTVLSARVMRADGTVEASYPKAVPVDAPAARVYRAPIRMEGFDDIGEVVIEISTAAAEAAVRASARTLVLQTVTSFLAVMIVLFVILRFLVWYPLRRLDHMAQRLGRGDLDSGIGLNKSDELGRLAGTMDAVRTSLKRSYDEIREQNEELRAANAIKSQFLATMSHEIRTPLNGIIGFAGLLLETQMDREQSEMVSTINASADSLLRIINDILDMSKIEAGRMVLERIEFDLVTLVEEVGVLLAAAADEKGVELVIHIAPTVPGCVVGDPLRLRQVLTNLVGNAVKFTATGEVVIRVTEVARAGDNSLLRFQVIDTGVGIDPAQLADIFKAFRQADQSTTRQYGGTGLGLSIARGLVECMGGTIQASSEPGGGSRFWFDVPLDCGPRPEPLASLTGPVPRAIVIDDNQPFVDSLGGWLRSWDIEHEHAVDIDAAEKLLTANGANHYGVVVLESDASDRCGWEAFRDFLARVREHGLPLALLLRTSQRPPPGWEKDFAVCLNKPVRLRVLHDCLREALEQRKNTLPPSSPVSTETGSNELEAKRVLVVEDSAVNQRLIRAVLKQLGVGVQLAVNGKEAVSEIAEQGSSYQLILMDCQMPVMDGYTATQTIRGLSGDGARIPIVALTANAMRGDREKCLESGMDDYLSKPVKPSVLRDTVRRWLDQGRGPVDDNDPFADPLA